MKIKTLYDELIGTYTIDNLNKICFKLIELYKNQQYSILQKIAEIISDSVEIEISDNGKGFSKFMMLYHPDRLNFHIKRINNLFTQNNYKGLLEYSHIIRLQRIEEIAESLNNYEDIDYSPVYEWDFSAEGFNVIHDSEPRKRYKTSVQGCNFYDAVKKRIFENVETEFPSYYLEDIEEFELSSSDIDDLDGVEFCVHALSMDLSDNMVSDLTPLFGLSLLEELNLSDNRIEDIDVLSNLVNLKQLTIANNNIKDISPLFNLSKLEYVNLEGNKVKKQQIDELVNLGITVDA